MKVGINSLVRNDAKQGKLDAASCREAVNSKTARSSSGSRQSSPGGSSGIASPLTEVGTREYYAESSITSSDGLFVLVFKRPEKMFFEDAAGRDIEIDYIDPNA